MADEIDLAGQHIEAEDEKRKRAVSQYVASIPVGEPGECGRCGEESLRLVRGTCARCRDKFKLP